MLLFLLGTRFYLCLRTGDLTDRRGRMVTTAYRLVHLNFYIYNIGIYYIMYTYYTSSEQCDVTRPRGGGAGMTNALNCFLIDHHYIHIILYDNNNYIITHLLCLGGEVVNRISQRYMYTCAYYYNIQRCSIVV